MGFVEYFDETTGAWTNLEDVPLFDTINCQLCNEQTEAHDIIAEIKCSTIWYQLGSNGKFEPQKKWA